MEPLTRYRRRLDRPVVAVRLDLLAYRIDDVVPSKSLEYLISTRHWLDGTLPDHNVQIARLSADVREFLNRRGQHAPALQRAPEPQKESTRVSLGQAYLVEEGIYKKVEAELARHIGPIARHLTKAAAAKAVNFEGFVSRLAAELDSDAERMDIVERCRKLS
jgi:hypothetical protein